MRISRCALSERQTEDLRGSEAMHRGPAVQSSIHVCQYTGLPSQYDHLWRILLAADRLIRSDDAVATIALIAWLRIGECLHESLLRE
jgi:hypothetical protein